LSGLRSRFAPIPITAKTRLADYGLARDQNPLTVTVKLDQKDHALTIGEEAGESNKFVRPSYLRLDDSPEIVRLAPGLVAALDRPRDYYQQRRLFSTERVAKEENPTEKVERLIAKEIAVEGPQGKYKLTRTGD